MRVAVASRPVEQFETEVPLPDWQLEPDEESWGLPYEYGNDPLVDENGMSIVPADPLAPIPAPGQAGQAGQPGTPDQTELDRIFNSPLPARERRPPPPPPPQPRSEPPADPLQPRSETSQQ